VVTVYLYKKGKPTVYTLVPMLFMVVMTVYAMIYNLKSFLTAEIRNYPLIVVAILVLGMALWLCVEAFIAFLSANGRRRAASADTLPDLG
jgi:carbon starvation protein